MQNIINLDLKRAEAARLYATEITEKKSEYKAAVEKMPMLIYGNGLAAAIAFQKAKNPKCYQHAFGWMKKYQQDYSIFTKTNIFTVENNFLQDILSLESTEYRLATKEMMAFLTWLKRIVGAWDKIETVNNEKEEGE